jgi:hypothetical protein
MDMMDITYSQVIAKAVEMQTRRVFQLERQ